MSRKSRSSKQARSGLSPWLLIVGIVLALLVVGGATIVSGGLPAPGAGVAPAPPVTTDSAADSPVVSLPQAQTTKGTWFTLYFTRPSYPEKKENRTGGVDTAIVADLDRAQKTVDAAVFDLRLPSLVDALARAAARGVPVRAVVDYTANKDAVEFTDAITKLENAGVRVVRDHRSALMHNKFVVIDNRLLWTGSMNFTANDTFRNNNNMLRLTAPALLQNYGQIFERLFLVRAQDAPGKEIPNPRVTLERDVQIANYFSPNGGARQAILERLQAAQSSIRFTAFTFTDTAMAELLMTKHKAGVAVKGVLEKRNTEALGGEYAAFKRGGMEVLEDGNCYILHSKLFIIDDKTVITGSYNFTDAANRTNDENLLIIDDPALAKLYLEEFDRIYRQAQEPTKCGSGG